MTIRSMAVLLALAACLAAKELAAQGWMLSRLAFFLGKRGYRGQLLTDARLSGKHDCNAHDYGGEGG